MIPALQAFAGDWRLDRQIEDRRAGAVGLLTGTARFTPEDGGLRYREDGVLRFPGGAPMQASREYLWRAETSGIAVFFADGRDFHRIGAGAHDSHWCDPDTYAVRYDFSRWPDWSALWEVRGPRKDYRMQSAYARA